MRTLGSAVKASGQSSPPSVCVRVWLQVKLVSANKLLQPFLNLGVQPEERVQKTTSQILDGNAASHSVGERSGGEIKIHPVYIRNVSNRMENTSVTGFI